MRPRLNTSRWQKLPSRVLRASLARRCYLGSEAAAAALNACANACLRRLGRASGARGLARGCHRDNATMSTSAGWPRADTAAHSRGYGFARACLRARPGGGAPQPSACVLALDESATPHAVSSTAASWRRFRLIPAYLCDLTHSIKYKYK